MKKVSTKLYITQKIIDYIIGKANVAEKIVSVAELYNFDDAAAKPAKKTAAKKESSGGTKKNTKKSA